MDQKLKRTAVAALLGLVAAGVLAQILIGTSSSGLSLATAPADLGAMVEMSGAAGRIEPLVEGDLSILVLGSADCGHCRRMHEEALDDLQTLASVRGVGLGYLPVGFSAPTQAALAVALCAAPSGDAIEARSRVDAAYLAVPSMYAVRDLEPADAKAELSRIVDQLGAAFALSGEKAQICASNSGAAQAQMSTVVSAFGLEGTPSVYVKSASGETFMFSGYGSVDNLLEKVVGALDR